MPSKKMTAAEAATLAILNSGMCAAAAPMATGAANTAASVPTGGKGRKRKRKSVIKQPPGDNR